MARGRTSLEEKYGQLQRRQGQMVAAHSQVQPSAVHLQTVRVLGDLLTMGAQFSNGNVPAPLRAMMRMLHKMEPELARELAGVPPEAIREFLLDLVRRMLTIVDVPLEEVRGHPNGAPQPGENQPPP